MATPYSGASVPQEQVSSLEQRLLSIESGISDLAYLLSISSDEANQIANIDDSVFVTARWAFLAGLAIDDYYTEDEVDALLAGKSDTTHDHDSDYSAIGHDHDSDYSAIGHDHDSRYYTEDEIDTIIQNSRDLLINGNMRWWQRGTSFTSVTNGAFSADRWKNLIAAGSGTAPVFNIAIDNTDGINYLMKLTVTTSGVAGTGMYAGVYQKYEFYTMMKGKTVSARIRVNIPSGKTARLYVYDGVGGTGVTITGTGAFQEVTVSHTVSTSATALQVTYYIANGTTINAASGDIHYIDRIQLTEGATALPFLPYDNIIDYKKCLRYYEKSYNYADAPGTASATGSVRQWCQVANVSVLNLSVQFSVTKRTTPSMIWYSYDGVANYIGVYGVSNIAVSSEALMSEKRTGCPVLASAPTVDQLLIAHWVADAEM